MPTKYELADRLNTVAELDLILKMTSVLFQHLYKVPSILM